MDIIFSLTFNALIAASVYALIASGLSFIYATTRIFHLAHGAVIALAGYVCWWGVNEMQWPLLVSAVVGCVAAVVAGSCMNELVYEPLRRRGTKGIGYLVATIALLLLSNAAIIAVFGAQTLSLNIETSILTLGGIRLTVLQIILFITSVVLLAGLWGLMKYTTFGKAMRATADNETIAGVLGIDTRRIRRIVFAIGSLLGGIAGVLIALEFNLEPNMGVMMAIKGFTAMVVGGVGSMIGAVSGSATLAGVEQAAVWFLGASWKDAMAFTLLFVFLLVRPRGFFGRKRFQ